jgi:site-specific DNA-methyltransferase (adenine-specific)
VFAENGIGEFVELMKKTHGWVYQGKPFVWVKTKKDGTPFGATGPRARTTKPITEDVFAFSNVKKGPPFKVLDQTIPQTVFEPRQEHSRKPEEVRRRIERMYGSRPSLEVFARGTVPTGWDGWGNEFSENSSVSL